MKKIDKIKEFLSKDKEFSKLCIQQKEAFIDEAFRYIKAIKEGRVIVCIKSVSKSGMSRRMSMLECRKSKRGNEYRYLNFYSFLSLMNHKISRIDGSILITGCGMDMIFHTNYSLIYRLYNLGFMSLKERAALSQETPQTI